MTDAATVEGYAPFDAIGAVLQVARLPMPADGPAGAVVGASSAAQRH